MTKFKRTNYLIHSSFQASKKEHHLVTDQKTKLIIEIDTKGNGKWDEFEEVEIDGYAWYRFDPDLNATWVRLRSAPLGKATAWFHLGNDGENYEVKSSKFSRLAESSLRWQLAVSSRRRTIIKEP